MRPAPRLAGGEKLRSEYAGAMKTRHPSLRASPRSHPTRAEVTARARLLWEQRGCPVGVDEEIWYEAERQLGGPAADNDGARIADPDALLDPAGDPADDLDQRLKQLADAPGQRSSTSL